jgi:hypothetical protein
VRTGRRVRERLLRRRRVLQLRLHGHLSSLRRGGLGRNVCRRPCDDGPHRRLRDAERDQLRARRNVRRRGRLPLPRRHDHLRAIDVWGRRRDERASVRRARGVLGRHDARLRALRLQRGGHGVPHELRVGPRLCRGRLLQRGDLRSARLDGLGVHERRSVHRRLLHRRRVLRVALWRDVRELRAGRAAGLLRSDRGRRRSGERVHCDRGLHLRRRRPVQRRALLRALRVRDHLRAGRLRERRAVDREHVRRHRDVRRRELDELRAVRVQRRRDGVPRVVHDERRLHERLHVRRGHLPALERWHVHERRAVRVGLLHRRRVLRLALQRDVRELWSAGEAGLLRSHRSGE